MALSSRNGFFKFLLVVFVGCANHGHSSALTFNVCADDYQYIYADGVLLGYQTKYYYIDLQVTIPASTTVVAVKVVNFSGPAGWKGYFSDGKVADGSWKCTSTAQADDKWTLASYDDSKWTAPLSSGASPAECNKGSYSSAKWLWTEPTYNEAITIYCRKRLDMTFNVCSDDYQWIYADGVLLGSQTNTWYVDLPVKVPSDTSVIGVRVINNHGPAGVKGYFSDGSVMDSSWKCTSTAQKDNSWTLATFDDSTWTSPVSSAASPAECNKGAYSSAKWLWTEPTYSQVITIYCRKRLALIFSVCADDFQYIYADGVLLGWQADWYYVDVKVKVPINTRVLAVKVKNYSAQAGFKGYLSDGRVMDGSWKCTSTAQADDSWTLATFDDSKWVAPVSSGTSPAECNKGSYSSAKWLWIESTYSRETTVYCRKRLA